MISKTKIWISLILIMVGAAAAVFIIFFYKPKLTVLPKPGDAEVLLDSQPITPGVPLKLAPGNYTITVRAKGYLTSKRTVRLDISQIVDLPIELKEIPTAQVLLNGVRFPAFSLDQKTIFYLGKDGNQFFRAQTELGADGQPITQPVSAARFQNIKDVVWSPDRLLALIFLTNNQLKLFDFKRYDFLNQEETDLGTLIRSAAWHPTDPVFVGYRVSQDGERSLVRTNIRSGLTDRLIDLRDQNFANPYLSWSPDGRQILIVENALYRYDVQSRQISKVAGTEGARAARWSPTNTEILVELEGNQLMVAGLPESDRTGRLSLRVPIIRTAWTTDGHSLIYTTQSDQNRDIIQRLNLSNEFKTTYRYLSNTPINADQISLTNADRTAWLLSSETLFNILLEEESN